MDNKFEVVAERKPKTANFKETSERLRNGKKAHLAHKTSLDFRADKATVCVEGSCNEYVAIEDLKNTIMMSTRTGAALIDDVKNLEISYDEQTLGAQLYTSAEKTIIALNPNHPKGDLLNMLAAELRRAWQHKRGALISPLNFQPDDAVLVGRAQNADTFVAAIAVAWELKLAGENDMWDYAVTSPIAPMARAYEVKASRDFRALNNGEAAREAYDRFFQENIATVYDRKVIHQMLLDDKGYMKNAAKENVGYMKFFAKLGEMPNAANYLTRQSSQLPTEENYIKVEDRSNANFLWFIKFERSFQEKEQAMVKASEKVSAEIVDFAAARRQRRNEAA